MKNFDKILDYYDDQDNKQTNQDDEEPVFDANLHLKPENIFKTFKCTTNLFFE